jgi:hypothetical protein
MNRFLPAVLVLCVFGLRSARGDEPPAVVDPLTLWNSNTTALWGANVFQKVDPENRKQWTPLLRKHDFRDLQRAGANYVNFSVPGPYEPDSGNYNADDWEHLKTQVRLSERRGT